MLIKESQLRAIIREELLKEHIKNNLELMQEGFMSDLGKYSKEFGIAALLSLTVNVLNPLKAFADNFKDIVVRDMAKSSYAKVVKAKKEIGNKNFEKFSKSIDLQSASEKLDKALHEYDTAFSQRDALDKFMDAKYAKVDQKTRDSLDKKYEDAQAKVEETGRAAYAAKKEYDKAVQKLKDTYYEKLADKGNKEVDRQYGN